MSSSGPSQWWWNRAGGSGDTAVTPRPSEYPLQTGPDPAHRCLHAQTCARTDPSDSPCFGAQTPGAYCLPEVQTLSSFQDTPRAGWPRQDDLWSRVTTLVRKMRMSPVLLPSRTSCDPQTRALERKSGKSPTQLAAWEAAGGAWGWVPSARLQWAAPRTVKAQGQEKCTRGCLESATLSPLPQGWEASLPLIPESSLSI